MKFRFCGDLDCPDWVLSEIATLSKLTSVRVKVLVNQVISYCVQNSFNYEKILKLSDDNYDGVNDVKGAVAAVHFIITNAGKHDVDEQSLIQEIQQLGLPKENSEALGRQYREHKDALREALVNNSYRISKVLSTDWRVDLVLGTSKVLPTEASNTISSAIQEPSVIQGGDTPSETGLAIHVNIKYDTRPQDGPVTSDSSKDRIKNTAFELSPEKLDLLIHELTNATAFLDNLGSG